MAIEGVSVTPGNGAPIATDFIGNFHYQIFKLAIGADGSATIIDDANPIPVGGTALTTMNTNLSDVVAASERTADAVEATVTSLPPFALGTTTRYLRKIIDISSSSEATQIAAVSGQTIRVHYFRLVTPVASNELGVWNGPVSDASQLDLLSFAGAGAGFEDYSETDPLWITSSNKGLVFKPTGSARITGMLLYTQSA